MLVNRAYPHCGFGMIQPRLSGPKPLPCFSSQLGTHSVSPFSRSALRSGARRMIRVSLSIQINGAYQTLDTWQLVKKVFAGEDNLGVQQNLRIWIDLRNSVAHRHLPSLDFVVIPHAQAALLNFENTIVREFGPSFAIAERLSVPLQLSGFREPGVLASRKKLQASLPLDVQLLLARPELDHPSLGSDETFLLRVAFIPVVPASTNSPDAIALLRETRRSSGCHHGEHRPVPCPT